MITHVVWVDLPVPDFYHSGYLWQHYASKGFASFTRLKSLLLYRQATATRTAFPGRQQIDYLSGFDEDGGDYYSILGLDPGADKKSIKRAYYDAMRDCHPDSNDTEEAHEFATFLNEIHEVRCCAALLFYLGEGVFGT